MRLGLEEAAARIGMWLASVLEEVDGEHLRRVLGASGSARVLRGGDGVYLVELRDDKERPALLVVLAEQPPGWPTRLAYVGHTILNAEALGRLYASLRDEMEKWR